MALITCEECNHKISDQAKSCPSCGALKKKEKSLMLPIIAIAIFVGFAWQTITKNDGTPSVTVPFPESTKTISEPDTCKIDDIKCLGNKGYIHATGYCKRHIEKLSTNDFKWTDGILSSMFSSFQWLDKEHGTITYIGDKIKFQNENGVFINMVYSCDVLATGTVISVRTKPGKLN